MKPRVFSIVLAVFAATLMCVGVAVAVDKGGAVIKIDTNGKGKLTPAFPHHKHMELKETKGKCEVCHHTTKPGKQPAKCASCHKDKKAKDEKTGAIGWYKAYHDQCLNCHKKQKDKPALKKCKTCHPKK